MMKAGDLVPLTLPGDVAMPFRYIPPCPDGFWMGQRGKSDGEEPRHRVVVSEGFLMAETPVTQAQFAAVVSGHKHEFPNRPDHPAENISWLDAWGFCQRLSETGFSYEGYGTLLLPSESHWEYACRAGSTTEYCSGDGVAALEEVANLGRFWHDGPPLVGTKDPNAWRLLDMHGGVLEWCSDFWDYDYWKRAHGWKAEVAAPQDPGNKTEFRVVRGGSWGDTARNCRSACRFRNSAGFRSWNYGFRVCLFPGPSPAGGQDPVQAAEAAGAAAVDLATSNFSPSRNHDEC